MEEAHVAALLEQLDGSIDHLDDVLAPLLKAALSETAAKLPLLDKAKLSVMMTYAIESCLFSYLRLSGINARDHAVFRELTRVKQYFEKIKAAEANDQKRENMTLDKPAAGRFIKHALASNDKYDRERAEKESREKNSANARLEGLSKKRRVDDSEAVAADQDESLSGSSEGEEDTSSPPTQPASRTAKSKQAKSKEIEATTSPTGPSKAPIKRRSTAKKNKAK